MTISSLRQIRRGSKTIGSIYANDTLIFERFFLCLSATTKNSNSSLWQTKIEDQFSPQSNDVYLIYPDPL